MAWHTCHQSLIVIAFANRYCISPCLKRCWQREGWTGILGKTVSEPTTSFTHGPILKTCTTMCRNESYWTLLSQHGYGQHMPPASSLPLSVWLNVMCIVSVTGSVNISRRLDTWVDTYGLLNGFSHSDVSQPCLQAIMFSWRWHCAEICVIKHSTHTYHNTMTEVRGDNDE